MALFGVFCAFLAMLACAENVRHIFFPRRRDGLGESISLCLTILTCSSFTLLAVVAGYAPRWALMGLLAGGFISACMICSRPKGIQKFLLFVSPLLLLSIVSVLSLCVLSSHELGHTFDWYIYYSRVNLFHDVWAQRQIPQDFLAVEYLAKRPPFFVGLIGVLTAADRSDFAVFEVACVLLNSIILFPILSLLRSFGLDRRQTWIALCLLPIMPIMQNLLMQPSPKPLAMVLLFTGLGSLFFGKALLNSLVALTLMVAAVLFHPLAILFLPVAVPFVGRHPSLNFKCQDILIISSVITAMVSFLLWIQVFFSWQNALSPPFSVAHSPPQSVFDFILSRVGIGLSSTFLPLQLSDLIVQELSGTSQAFMEWIQYLFRFQTETIIGGFGIVVIAGLFYESFVLRKHESSLPEKSLSQVILSGSFLCLVLHFTRDFKGLAATLFPALVVWTFCQAASHYGRAGRIYQLVLAVFICVDRAAFYYLSTVGPVVEVELRSLRIVSGQLLSPHLIGFLSFASLLLYVGLLRIWLDRFSRP